MESEYIRKVLQGDPNAYRYFVDKYRDMAYSVAVSIVRDPMVAEEVTQDAFIRAYKALAAFEQRSKFSTWLYKIVTNEGLKKIRGKTFRYMEGVQAIDEVEYSGINLSVKDLAEEEQKYYINKCLAKLLPNDCLVMRLFYLEERTLKEIEEITTFSVTNIKTILHRARKRFYVYLKEELNHEIKSIL